MRAFVIAGSDVDRRLDHFAAAKLPSANTSLVQKLIRLKRIKRNDKPAVQNDRLAAGDVVSFYVDDALFERPVSPMLTGIKPRLRIRYEDARIALIDKAAGQLIHPEGTEHCDTVVTHLQAYLYQRGEYSGRAQDFAPSVCNRLDRFTSGIVIAAKTRAANAVLLNAIRGREILKDYLCLTRGNPRLEEGVLHSYLQKGARRVRVLHEPAEGAQEALTAYRVLCRSGEVSLLWCRLLTGRTHQIRAQFADAGYPLLGDPLYGDPAFNARHHRNNQALCAYRVTFDFAGDAGELNDLNGRSWTVQDVPFLRDYFPDIADAVLR